MVETKQEALLVVARHPWSSVGKYCMFGYLSCLSKVNQPSADLSIVVYDQNTATHNLW